MQHPKSSCQKALDILRVMGHADWGADHISLCLYNVLVRSKLDYRCIVYRLACQSILKQLDPIHHQGWCIALGAFRTSAQSFYVEAHTLSLASSRLKLSLNYVLKLKSLPESVLKIPPLGICILLHLEKSSINLNLIDIASSVDITPWMLSVPTVHLDLTK